MPFSQKFFSLFLRTSCNGDNRVELSFKETLAGWDSKAGGTMTLSNKSICSQNPNKTSSVGSMSATRFSQETVMQVCNEKGRLELKPGKQGKFEINKVQEQAQQAQSTYSAAWARKSPGRLH